MNTGEKILGFMFGGFIAFVLAIIEQHRELEPFNTTAVTLFIISMTLFFAGIWLTLRSMPIFKNQGIALEQKENDKTERVDR